MRFVRIERKQCSAATTVERGTNRRHEACRAPMKGTSSTSHTSNLAGGGCKDVSWTHQRPRPSPPVLPTTPRSLTRPFHAPTLDYLLWVFTMQQPRSLARDSHSPTFMPLACSVTATPPRTLARPVHAPTLTAPTCNIPTTQPRSLAHALQAPT